VVGRERHLEDIKGEQRGIVKIGFALPDNPLGAGDANLPECLGLEAKPASALVQLQRGQLMRYLLAKIVDPKDLRKA